MCDGYFSLVNTTNQLLTMADSGGTTDNERLRNLNNEMMTEDAELRVTVEYLRVDYVDARNELDRIRVKLKKINDVNMTLAAMFHVGKGKRMKGKGLMAMAIEAGNEDVGVKLALESSLHVFINQMWENANK